MRSAGLSGLGESTPKIFGLRSRSQSAALWFESRVLCRVLPRAPEALGRPRAQQEHVSLAQFGGRLPRRALQVLGGDVLARRDVGDVQAGAVSAERLQPHAVDRGRVRTAVEVAERVDVRRAVVAQQQREALVGEVAVEVRRRVLVCVVLPDDGLLVARVHGHPLVDLLGQVDEARHRSSMAGAHGAVPVSVTGLDRIGRRPAAGSTLSGVGWLTRSPQRMPTPCWP